MEQQVKMHVNKFAAKVLESSGRWPGGQCVWGQALSPGDVISGDDVYESTSGNWEPAPCPGLKLQEGCATVWVRPEKYIPHGEAQR